MDGFHLILSKNEIMTLIISTTTYSDTSQGMVKISKYLKDHCIFQNISHTI